MKKLYALPLIAWLLVTASASIIRQESRADEDWLDHRLVNWNQRTKASLLRPPAGGVQMDRRCRELLARQPEGPTERSLAGAGWTLYGAVQSYGSTRVMTVTTGVDGMCRPLGYQALVYHQGKFAGTLSPVLMLSRMDGALTEVRLISETRITAEFARYTESDPLCCPSQVSYVDYEIKGRSEPLVTPLNVSTSPVCRESADAGNDSPANDSSYGSANAQLFNRRWRLAEIRGSAVKAGEPFIMLNDEKKTVSGNTGCNLMSGGFEINGASISFQRLITTKRACLDNEMMRTEREFTRALEETTRFELQGTRLRFYAGNEMVLGFTGR